MFFLKKKEKSLKNRQDKMKVFFPVVKPIHLLLILLTTTFQINTIKIFDQLVSLASSPFNNNLRGPTVSIDFKKNQLNQKKSHQDEDFERYFNNIDRSDLEGLKELDQIQLKLNQLIRTESVSSSSELLENIPEYKKKSCYEALLENFPNCSVLSGSNSNRICFAIRLTICELVSNSINVPRECTLWLQSTSKHGSDECNNNDKLNDVDGHEREEEDRDGKRKACVIALHNSPQFWSSFSGNHRDSIQLCLSHQKINQLKLLEDLKSRTSLISSQLIKSFKLLLNQLDKSREERRRDEDQRELRAFEKLKVDLIAELRDEMDHRIDKSLSNSFDVEFSRRKNETFERQWSERLFKDLKSFEVNTILIIFD
ncbi:hypothetical protein BY996DRAFT_1968709 [Phakopsora pachyrhizi]|nr:hypothetical protein BY996DRAFT_1968709 [Phakopsora pachyrhizi]